MAWPPPVPPNNRANTTPSFDNHPGDHNLIADALNEIIGILGADPSGGFADISAAMLNLLPVGAMVMHGSTTAPSGWLACEGQEINRTTYSRLFAVIGTSFGAGNGTTTFNVPDLRGRVPTGVDAGDTAFNAIGEKGGNKNAAVISHNHAGPNHRHVLSHNHSIAHNHPSVNSTTHQHNLRERQTNATDGTGLNLLRPLGASDSLKVNASAQAVTVDIPNYSGSSGAASNANTTNAGTGNTSTVGESATNRNLAPYIALPFIIRTGA